jgi:hypothetical protein
MSDCPMCAADIPRTEVTTKFVKIDGKHYQVLEKDQVESFRRWEIEHKKRMSNFNKMLEFKGCRSDN